METTHTHTIILSKGVIEFDKEDIIFVEIIDHKPEILGFDLKLRFYSCKNIVEYIHMENMKNVSLWFNVLFSTIYSHIGCEKRETGGYEPTLISNVTKIKQL